VTQPFPSNLTRDFEARNLGNQRQIANRQFSGAASPQFSTRSTPSYSAQRSFSPSGGFGGGGFRGGGFGGRGGGRR
jgi:hypothetical protein